MLRSCLNYLRFSIGIILIGFIFASGSEPMPMALAGGLPERSDRSEIYQLHVDNPALAQQTLQNLVALLEGRSHSTILKDRISQTLRMEVTLPQDQSAYFISKLPGLGELTAPLSDINRNRGTGENLVRLIFIDIIGP